MWFVGVVGERIGGSPGCVDHVGAEVRRRQRNIFMLPSIILEQKLNVHPI
jgi:hypothetical protein